MEIAKFVFTAVGTFLSVFGMSFTVFQYWRKKQDEKIDGISSSLGRKIQAETDQRKETEARLTDRVDKLELYFAKEFEGRMSKIEGKLDGVVRTLEKIQDWFMKTPERK